MKQKSRTYKPTDILVRDKKGQIKMENIINIKVEHIHPHPENPRKQLGDLTELAESIKKNGIWQNLTVTPQIDNPGEYTIIIGHRRHAASILAEISEVPCKVMVDLNERELIGIMLGENLQREDLTIYEQAQGFQMLMDLGETEETIAEKTGFCKATIRKRLSIAKLDQKILQEKEKDNNFQMTLGDLSALDRVKDVKTRNKILESAKSSREIVSMADRAVNEAIRNARLKQLNIMLKKMGVKQAPNAVIQDQWSGKWRTEKEIDLDKEIPETIALEEIDTLYHLQSGRYVRIIKPAKKVKRELTPQELVQKEKDKNKRAIKAKLKDMGANRKEFIHNIITGKIRPVKNEDEIIKMAWGFLLESGGYMCLAHMRNFFEDKEDFKCSDEEKNAAQIKVDGLSITYSMLVALHNAARDIGDIFDWKGDFKPEIGERLVHCYEALKPYGWTFANDDDLLILTGKHELYAKADVKKK